MQLALGSGDSVKRFALPSVEGHHPAFEGLDRTKRWRKEEFGPSCLVVELGIKFSAFSFPGS